MKSASRRWAVSSLVLLCLSAKILVAQTSDSVHVRFTPVGAARPLTTVGGVLHADDCDSVRILSLTFTWHSHHPPYQVQPLNWFAANGQNVPQNFPLPPTAPGFPEDVHITYVVYPDGTVRNLDIDSLVAGRSYSLAPGCPPVPIQLSSFIGRVINNRVRLDWTTVSEVNNYGFFVQKRRASDTEWSEIPNSFTPGHGTTNVPQHYTFTDNAIVTGPVQYRLKQVDLDGTVHFTEPIHVGFSTAVEELIPHEFSLQQNYPNPFNPTTTIRFGIPGDAHVCLAVHNTLGETVAMLVDEQRSGGYHDIVFDASSLASGIYIYRLQAFDASSTRSFVATKKLLLIK